MSYIREAISIFKNKLQRISFKKYIYAKVMRTKKRATIFLQSNHVGSFDYDRTHLGR